MGFVSFLKSFGMILAKLAMAEVGIVQGVKVADPAIAPTVDKLDSIFQNIVATEGMFQAAYPGQQTGAQKLAAAGTLVTPILNSVQLISGKKIANATQYSQGVQTVINGIVAMLNSVEGSAPVTTPIVTAPGVAAAGSTATKPA